MRRLLKAITNFLYMLRIKAVFSRTRSDSIFTSSACSARILTFNAWISLSRDDNRSDRVLFASHRGGEDIVGDKEDRGELRREQIKSGSRWLWVIEDMVLVDAFHLLFKAFAEEEDEGKLSIVEEDRGEDLRETILSLIPLLVAYNSAGGMLRCNIFRDRLCFSSSNARKLPNRLIACSCACFRR